jgi:SAM-dependent methyltransferase
MNKMREINLTSELPRSRARPSRDVNERDVRVAREFGFEYFDGARSQGYGGYYYDGRWTPVARTIVDYFGLRPGDRVLDVGCAKGFLVRDLMYAGGLDAWGLDVSQYAIEHAHEDTRDRIVRGCASRLPFAHASYDAVLAINVVHNLERDDCVRAVREIERVSNGRAYIQVDAWRTESERRAMLDWVLTARTLGSCAFWRGLFNEAGYTGAYYWTIMESAFNES